MLSSIATTRVLATQTKAALHLFGAEVATRRRVLRWTAAELSERAGVSVPTLRRIERGDPGVSIGSAFEVARLVGIELWGDVDEVQRHLARRLDKLVLLPERVRPATNFNDDF
jgi:transcriptional regulator with XRE-family HTH domain